MIEKRNSFSSLSFLRRLSKNFRKEDHQRQSLSFRKTQRFDLHRSSPSLIDQDVKLKKLNKTLFDEEKFKSDVLKFTNCSTHGSLITLRFSEDDELIDKDMRRWSSYTLSSNTKFQPKIEENINNVTDSLEYEETIYETIDQLKKRDFYDWDSDSGISSLYETIREIQSVPQNYQKARKDDIRKSSEYILEKVKIDPKLFYIFQRKYEDVNFISLSMKIKILANVSNWMTNFSTVEETVGEMKQRILQLLTMQQDQLCTLLKKRRKISEEINNSLRACQDYFLNVSMENRNRKLIRKYLRVIGSLDSLVNLLVGLELRKAADESGDFLKFKENSEQKLEEALVIKDENEERLANLLKMLPSSEEFTIRKLCNQRIEVTCELRILKQELFFLEQQVKLLCCS